MLEMLRDGYTYLVCDYLSEEGSERKSSVIEVRLHLKLKDSIKVSINVVRNILHASKRNSQLSTTIGYGKTLIFGAFG